MGYLIAHSLRSTTSTNITLHFHRLRQADLFNALYGLTLHSPHSPLPTFRDGFGYEMKDIRMRRAVPFIPAILDSHRSREYTPTIAQPKIRVLPDQAVHPPRLEGNEGKRETWIEVLVMAKRSGDVVRSLMQIRHRLRRESTIVVLHGGMGALAEVQGFWPEEGERPNIVEGFSTHGLTKRDEFTVHHWGSGKIHLAIAPRLDESDIFAYTSVGQTSLPDVIGRYNFRKDIRLQYLERGNKYKSMLFILEQLLGNEVLNCTLRAYFPHFYLLQLRRTILQSILQTLGAIQQATNSQLIQNRINHKIIGRLLLELLPVLQKDPLIASSPHYLSTFSFSKLYSQLRIMALTNPHHVHTLQQDIAGKKENELAYFSGFLLRLARQRREKLPMWRTLHEQVKALALGEQMKANEIVPVQKKEGGVELPEWTYDVEERLWKMQRYDQVVSEIRRPTAVEMMEREAMEARLAENIEDMPVKMESIQNGAQETEEIPAKEFTPSPLTQRLRVTSAADEPLRQRTIVKVPNLNPKDEHTEWKSRYARRLRRIDQLRLRTLSANRDIGHTEDEYAVYQEWKQRIKSDARDKTRMFEREGSWTAENQEVADKVTMETPGVAEEDVGRTEEEEQEQTSGVSEEDAPSEDGGKGHDGGKD